MSMVVFGKFSLVSEQERIRLLDYIESNRNDSFYVATEDEIWPRTYEVFHRIGVYNMEKNALYFELNNDRIDTNATNLLVGRLKMQNDSGEWVERPPVLTERLKVIEEFFATVFKKFDVTDATLYISEQGYAILSDYEEITVCVQQFAETLFKVYPDDGWGITAKVCIIQ